MTLKELIELLRNAQTIEEIDEKKEEIKALIPQVERMFDYDQKTPKQPYDLWTHSLKTVLGLPRDLEDYLPNNMVLLAALLHDIGKPDYQSVKKIRDREEVVYDGHEQRSLEILEQEIFPELETKGETLTEEEKDCLRYFIGYHHDMPGRMKRYVRKHMNAASCDTFCNLMKMGIADCKAQAMYTGSKERVRIYEYILRKSEDGFITIFSPAKWMI